MQNRAVIASDRLLALNWPREDPRIGVLKIGRNIVAFRNLRGLTISYNGEPILRLNTRLIIRRHPLMNPAHFYSMVREATDVLGVGAVQLQTKSGRLLATRGGVTHFGDDRGIVVIQL